MLCFRQRKASLPDCQMVKGRHFEKSSQIHKQKKRETNPKESQKDQKNAEKGHGSAEDNPQRWALFQKKHEKDQYPNGSCVLEYDGVCRRRHLCGKDIQNVGGTHGKSGQQDSTVETNPKGTAIGGRHKECNGGADA